MTDTKSAAPQAAETELQNKQQALLWRLLSACFGQGEKAQNLESLSKEITKDLGMPELVLDPLVSITTLLQRFPDLKSDFERPLPGAMIDEGSEGGVALTSAVAETPEPGTETPAASPNDRLRRTLVLSKLLLNAFGPATQTKTVTAQQYSQWTQDLGRLEEAFGYPQGGLRGRGGGGGGAGTGPGGGRRLLSEEDLRRGFQGLEGELVRRMELREVLKDSRLAAKLSPSIALVEQLLADKANLSGVALENAKKLIRAYVDQVAEVLKLQVQRASKGKFDRSTPPKRVFRNLDLKRTLWKNLTNWNPAEERLYVDRLIFRRTAAKTQPTRLLVVVDQSGSMVDAMVQSTILASIFAGLPKVDCHLIAFDTRVLDLTPWVHDPFEVLLRTELGGGTLIRQALIEASKKIVEPKNTAMVVISDFYEGGSDQELLDYIKGLKDSGVHFIPVGALQSSGYFSVSEFFRTRLAEMGMPILHGAVNKLIHQLRYLLN
ncbi:MAG: VWA domain-containing protein [Myxococcales bacterium]|nr:VWA domain-containing protein [Myxococcales bacterium]